MCRFIWQDIWETAGVLHGLLGLLGWVWFCGKTSGNRQRSTKIRAIAVRVISVRFCKSMQQ
jgi:hypothetical protein